MANINMRCVLTAMLAACGDLGAEPPSFTPLGHLPGGCGETSPSDVSASGAVVGLSVLYPCDDAEAFRWSPLGGMVGMGYLTGATDSVAEGISPDGTVIVGKSGTWNSVQAFRWTRASGMIGLGDLPGGSFSSQASA